MKNINLLPTDLGPSKFLLGVAYFCKKATILMSIVFFIAAIGFIVYFVIVKPKITNLSVSRDSLKESIAGLEETEQKLFLTKERIGKIKSILALYSVASDLPTVNSLVSNSAGVGIGHAAVSEEKTAVDTTFRDSSALSSFLAFLMQIPGYKGIFLNSLSFNPVTGYSTGFELSNK